MTNGKQPGMPDSRNNGYSELKKPRNIILCFDGTDGDFGPKPFTNILKIYRMLDNSDEDIQLCYYQPGIGTSMGFNKRLDEGRKPTIGKVSNLVDSMIAFTLDQHVCAAYLFLMRYYRPGDKVFMFGFSRGAFIARILAGMIERVGLLNEGLEDNINTAWKIYEAWEYAAQPSQPDYTTTLAEEFKKTFSRSYNIDITFQGLFDSVNSIGIVRDRLFPYAARTAIVKHVRHAVSLDERRGKFQQQSIISRPGLDRSFSALFRTLSSSFMRVKTQGLDRFPWVESSSSSSLTGHAAPLDKEAENDRQSKSLVSSSKNSRDLPKNTLLERGSHGSVQTQSSAVSSDLNANSGRESISPDVIEKWFPGDHADIGGGWIPDYETTQFLSNIPLRWMLAEAMKQGVLFKRGIIDEFSAKYPSSESFTALSHNLLSLESRGTAKSSFAFTEDRDFRLWGFLRRFFFNILMKGAWVLQLGPCYKKRCEEMMFRSCDFSSSTSARSLASNSIPLNSLNPSHAGRGNQSLWHFALWWIMELVPIKRRVQGDDCEWKNIYVPNFGRQRETPADCDLHWSVYWRMRQYKDYRPRNLPQYAREMLQEYADVLQPARNTLKTKVWAMISKWYAVTFLRPYTSKGCPPCQDTDEYNRVVAEARATLDGWHDNKSCTMPDDLKIALRNMRAS